MRPRRNIGSTNHQISRRKLVAVAAGAMLGSPSVASAQRNSAPVLGLLDAAARDADELAAFYDGLAVEGYIRNQTIEVLQHSAAGDYSRLPALADDLVRRQVSAITAFGVPAAFAARNATVAIPVVFEVGPNPVEIGLVGSFDLPGGNITGVTALSGGHERKRLDLLHELIPGAEQIALLVNPNNATAENKSQEIIAAIRAINVRPRLIRASAADQFDAAFDSSSASAPGGLIIADDDLFDSRAIDLGSLAFHRRIPTIFQGRAFAVAGGLISYGSNLGEIYHQAGTYTGLVLKGASAASLPVYQSTRIDFIINARTATVLGIEVPESMLAAANTVIR